MFFLFEKIEQICQNALNGECNNPVEEIENLLRENNEFDSFLGGFILNNVGEVIREYSEVEE